MRLLTVGLFDLPREYYGCPNDAGGRQQQSGRAFKNWAAYTSTATEVHYTEPKSGNSDKKQDDAIKRRALFSLWLLARGTFAFNHGTSHKDLKAKCSQAQVKDAY